MFSLLAASSKILNSSTQQEKLVKKAFCVSKSTIASLTRSRTNVYYSQSWCCQIWDTRFMFTFPWLDSFFFLFFFLCSMVISCVLPSVPRSWVPLGETHWRITSPFRSPAQPGPRPTTVLWTPTMSKLYLSIYFFTGTVFALALHPLKHQLIADSGLILFSLWSVRLFCVFKVPLITFRTSA